MDITIYYNKINNLQYKIKYLNINLNHINITNTLIKIMTPIKLRIKIKHIKNIFNNKIKTNFQKIRKLINYIQKNFKKHTTIIKVMVKHYNLL